ncbi:MAG: NAD(P)/FAD-dependent oxidoreductase [Verrucomicrobia bacterium]|nr:NAD(P)/FAD-dependent oxidoreductase [Verrucomicrobiota bacterium]
MTRPDHDLVVVGGGPAGLSTALFAAHRDPELRRRMVVLEKEPYPREKPCAGGLAGRADRALASIGVTVDVPSVWATGMSVALPEGGFFRRDPRGRRIGRVVRRVEFDHALAEQARARGIAVRDGVKVLRIARDEGGVTLETSAGTLRTRALVGADGVGSLVRKELAPGVATWRAQVLEVDTEPVDSDLPRDLWHFHVVDPDFVGYLWDFPTIVDGRPLVCRGAYHLMLPGTRADGEDLAARLGRRLAELGLDLGRCKKKRYAERGFSPFEPVAGPRVLLVGEAAGVDPITGEGIAQAILHGALAGPWLADRLRTGDLGFEGFPAVLARAGVGIDHRVRHELAHRFFGPSRVHYERALLAIPDTITLGVQYFGGLSVDKALLARVGLAIVRQGFAPRRPRDPAHGGTHA